MAGEGLGAGLIPALVGEWRLLYTSSNAMEYNQVKVACLDPFCYLRLPDCAYFSAHVCVRAIGRLLLLQ